MFGRRRIYTFAKGCSGANVAAIKKLLSLGAGTSNALFLSVHYAVKTKPLNLINTKTQNVLVSLEAEFASFAASTLLDHIALRQQINIGCEEDGVHITLYHLAASRGMWRFIRKLLRSTRVVGINSNLYQQAWTYTIVLGNDIWRKLS